MGFIYYYVTHLYVIAREEKTFFSLLTLTNDIIQGEAVLEYYGCMNGRENYDMGKLAGMLHLDREIWQKTYSTFVHYKCCGVLLFKSRFHYY